jgi:hypothetical protein
MMQIENLRESLLSIEERGKKYRTTVMDIDAPHKDVSLAIVKLCQLEQDLEVLQTQFNKLL